ncbi:MAG: GNAT family N-acetyltransferase [Solirubrobacterales bacterium]|nr:GNAT family N-acetyltransferase [Solirubrobacterales bacterium]
MSAEQTRLEVAGVERVDELRELWLHLHHHHRSVVGTLPLIDDDELSWQRRRALYIARISSGTGFLVLAINRDVVVGYAVVCIQEGPDDTFPVGERYAELYSLSVAPDRRGQGIGTRLLDFVDDELARRSIVDLTVAVMVGNDDALRLYARRGLRPGELVLYRFGARGQRTPESHRIATP